MIQKFKMIFKLIKNPVSFAPKIKPLFLILLCVCGFGFILSKTLIKNVHPPILHTPKYEYVFIGGGITTAMQSYYILQHALKIKRDIPLITIYEKWDSIDKSTVSNIAPSLTPDEILSVVPRGNNLIEALSTPFDQPGGIRIKDVRYVNESTFSNKFIQAVLLDSKDRKQHDKRTKILLQLGKESMKAWHLMYQSADPQLKKIFKESNYQPCREPKKEEEPFQNGYRVDLVYGIPNAKEHAERMMQIYKELGYKRCKILYPREVAILDPSLKSFCVRNSRNFSEWNEGSVALLRPGGCIDTSRFLPKFYAYLQKRMGTYKKNGKIENRFKLKLESSVIGVIYGEKNNSTKITGIKFENGKIVQHTPQHNTTYLFCPGSHVGTLSNFGFKETPCAGFAGVSLRLTIPISGKQLKLHPNFKNWMEIHKKGIVLAWQAEQYGDKVNIVVAGTKAFYGDQWPKKEEHFRQNRNLLQLNIINEVLPHFISLALSKDTRGRQLTKDDLKTLENKGIAKGWVGVRSCSFDGVPSIGYLYLKDGGKKVSNAWTLTHAGSGGVSFAPGLSSLLPKVYDLETNSYKLDPLAQHTLEITASNR